MEIGIIEFVAALVGIVSGVSAVFAAIQNRNKDSVKKRHEKAVEEMSDSRNGIYAHNAKEDSTLMRHYVRRSFRRARSNCDFSDCKKESNIHTKMLARYIRKSSGKNIVLFGDAGSGKSTAMRYLFYTLSGWQGNSRNVLVTLTRIGNSSKESPGIEMVVDRIRETLKTQGKGGKINLFLDSFDEAGFLYEGGMTAQDLLVELRNQFFIEGSFMKQVDNLILATRPGIFPDGAETVFNQFFSDRPVEVYELLPMGEKQILKSYRSLKYLKKANPDKYRDVFGTTAKIESVRRLRHYLEAEKRTLGKEDASFFSNPLLIRYAYLFVDDFQKGAAAEKKSMREMYDRLIDKIIKWEFHVWMSYETVKSLNEKEIEWQEYRKKAYSFLDGIVERMCDKVRQGNEAAVSELEMSVAADTDGTVAFKTEPEKMQTGITGDELLEIRVDDYISQIQRPIRHLLVPLTSETGKERTYCFCHSSFFEFLAGKYLSGEKAEYQLRRDLLIRYHATELPSFYYQYLCINSALAAKIAKSLEDVHVLTVDVCRALEGTKAAICKEPQLPAMEVYRYLPLIGELACQGIQISSQEMEQIYNKGKLDLSSAQVNDLDVVGWIVDYDQIRELDIHGMENMEIGKGNVAYSVLARMTNLIWIDLRGTCGWRTALSKLGETQLRTLTLDVSVKTEEDCDALSEVQAKIIRVELPEYSPLYQCLNSVSEYNSGITLYRRTSLDSALEKYQEDSVKNELPMLNAVYEMESRCLKFGESGSDATLWNGLSVVKCLADIDYMDESGREKELLERLTQYFRDRNDNLGMHFYRRYADYQIHQDAGKAVSDYERVYRNNNIDTDVRNRIHCGIALIKAYLNAGEINKAIEVQSEISNLQKQNQLERGDSLYYWKYSTVLYIKQNQYENATEAQKKLAVCVKKSSRYWQCTSFYLEAVLANVKGDHHKAELLCNNMEQYVRPIADIGELDRSEQAYWYMLFTQKTVAWWGLGKQKEALKLAIEIGDFPYWKTCSTSSICSRILKTYQNNEMLENEKIVVYEREIGKLKTSLWY